MDPKFKSFDLSCSIALMVFNSPEHVMSQVMRISVMARMQTKKTDLFSL